MYSMMAILSLKILMAPDMAYAANTSASVVRWKRYAYSVDNGVWFESRSAAGP